MIVLRIIGIAMVLVGLVFCLTIIGAAIGFPMMLIGGLLAFFGKKRAPIIVQIQQDPTKR